MKFWISALLALCLWLPVPAYACISEASGDYSDPDTWTDASCGVGGVPNEGTGTVTVSNGHTITLDQPDLVADNITWEQNGAFLCTSGASLHVLDWTTAVTGDDFFVDEYIETAGNGTTAALADDNWTDGIALGASGDHVLFRKGTHYDAASFDGEGKTIGSYGLGTIGYGPRPLWKLDATETITQTGAADTSVYHTEMACGDVLRATLVMDRTTCVAPCAIEFKLDVDQTTLNSTEPRLWRSSYSDNYTEVRGGEDWLFPMTKWNFGDPGSGYWERGARANTTTPASKNEEFPLPLAFHTYEKPGRYVVTAETCYSGQCVTNQTAVVIESAESKFHDLATWCFANVDDTFQGCPHDTNNDGTCDQNVTRCIVIPTADSDGVSTALEENCDVDATDVQRCLFRRGDTFTESDTQTDINNDDIQIGAFGDPAAAKPILDATSYTGGRLFDVSDVNRVTMYDIDIQMASNDQQSAIANTDVVNGTDCEAPEWDDVLFLRLFIDTPDNGILYQNNDVGAHNGCSHSNVVVQETELEGGGVLGDNQGNDSLQNTDSGAWLGNRWGNRDGDEHGIRCKTCTDTLWAHNDMGRILSTDNEGCGNPRFLLSVRNGFGPGQFDEGEREDDLAEEYSQRFGIVDNYSGPCGINGNIHMVERTSNAVTSPGSTHEFWHTYAFWGNLYSGLQRTDSSAFTMQDLGGMLALVANNAYFGDTDNTTTSSLQMLRVRDGKAPAESNLETNIQFFHVYNNAFFKNVDTAGGVPIRIGTASQGEPENVFIANNVFVDLNSSSDFIQEDGTGRMHFCNDSGTSCNQWESTNQFQSGITGLTGSDDDQPDLDLFKTIEAFRTSNDFGVVPDSEAADADAYENCRTDSTPILGIFEDGGSPCQLLLTPATNNDNSNAAIGVNLQRNEHWHSAMPWANAMKMGREWQSDTTAPCDFSGNASYQGDRDEAGYPVEGLDGAECVWTQIYSDTHAGQQWETGTWTLLFDGTADVALGDAANCTGDCSECDDGNCTFTVDTTTGGLKIGFGGLEPGNGACTSAANPNTCCTGAGTGTCDPLSNLRIYPPGGICANSATAPYGGFEHWSYCDDTGAQTLIEEDTCSGSYSQCVSIQDAAENGGLLFHPLFMKRMKPYRTVRLMDWLHTNSIADVTPQDYTVAIREERDWVQFGSATWHYDNRLFPTPWSTASSGNVPPEVAILFCDQIGAECWVNIPHFASDTEIRRLGAMCRDLTELDCIFELSNEAWNGGFDQTTDISNQADSEYGNCSTGTAACRDTWFANRTGEMCNLLCDASTGEFGLTDEEERCICLMGTQSSQATPTVTSNRFDCNCGSSCGTGAPTCDFDEVDGWTLALYVGRDAGDGTAGDCDAVTHGGTTTGLCSDTGEDSIAADIEDRIEIGGSGDFVAALNAVVNATPGTYDIYVYEGGTNFADTTSQAVAPDNADPQNTTLPLSCSGGNCGICLAVQVDTCMTTQYQDALDKYKDHFDINSVPVRTFVSFNSHSTYEGNSDATLSSFGNRGSWVGDETFWPKEQGLVDWSASNDCWWNSGECQLRGAASDPPPVPQDPGFDGGSITGGSISWVYDELDYCTVR